MEHLQPVIFIALGIIVLIIAVFKNKRNVELKKNGVKAEGIIFSLEPDKPFNNFSSPNTKEKIKVRFVTKEQKWITAELKQYFSFTNQYKEGDPVEIFYDPLNPGHFMINAEKTEKVVRLVFACLGIVFLISGIILALQ